MDVPRKAWAAGRFYPSGAPELAATVEELFAGMAVGERRVRALMLPHAGYVFSGRTAALALGQVDVPGRILIAGPNHTGLGESMALYPSGIWELPDQRYPIDEELSRVLQRAPGVRPDRSAHIREHSIEVLLPLIRFRRPSFRLTPLCLGRLGLETCLRLGRTIAHAVREIESTGESVLLVASTDMSHFLPADEARQVDQRALDRVLHLDPEGLFETVREARISMCGAVPTVVLLEASRALGAQRVELVDYTHSGERTGNHGEVVGYASAIVH